MSPLTTPACPPADDGDPKPYPSSDRSTTPLAELIRSGDVRECAACGEYSAYSWDLTTPKSEAERFGAGQIAHIITACCFDWQCGHCQATNVFIDSPTLDECYTHVERPEP